MMKDGRDNCCILGCRRTFKREGYQEVMCGEHYRLADKMLRALRSKLKRRARKEGRWSPRASAIDSWLWARIKRQATERALGL